MIERTTIRLPRDLLARAKRKAAAVGPQASTPSAPLSTATGPPVPGIDISNSAALQEMGDLEYVERLKNGFK